MQKAGSGKHQPVLHSAFRPVSPLGCWLIVALFFSGALVSKVSAQTTGKISKILIRHVGPPAVSDDLVRSNIRIKEGDPYSKLNVDDDVRNLYATGYFYNIRVGEEITNDGIVLTYVVQGKPTLSDIKFQGNKNYSDSKLRKKITSKVGQPMDERKLFSDSQAILEMYQKAGYQRTKVEPKRSIDENAGRGTVTFEITEAPKVRIIDVQFPGVQAFTEKKLRKTIKTRRHWMFSWLTGSGKLKDEQFEEDKEKLGEFYRSEGYIDFELKNVEFDYKEPTRLVLRFIISEGKQYKVGKVEFKGNKLFSTDDILRGVTTRYKKKFHRGLSMGVGEIFTPEGLAADREGIEDFYGAKGYIDSRIAPIKNPNTETGTMDLLYQIDEGDKSFIEKVDIKGNTKTKDRVIRRELAISPGEVFDMVRVKVSTNRLYGLNYFEKIDAQPEDTEIPNRKNLVIGIEEKNTGNFTIGAGFSTVENLVGFAEISQGNFDIFNPPYFTGGGQKARLRAAIGTQRKDYQLTFIEPWFLNRKLALSVDLYHRDLNYQSTLYDEKRTGARIGLTRTLGSDFLIGSVSYTIENVDLDFGEGNLPHLIDVVGPGRSRSQTVVSQVSPELLKEQGSRLVSKIGASLAYDTRNNALLPNGGQRTELITELAGGPLGADTDFYRFELRSAWYFKGFAEGHVLELVGRVGIIENYSNSDDVPLFDRYFLGGQYSLRGYDYRKVGPKDMNEEPLGGGTYWFARAEYSIPVIERLRFAVFYDAGMVYEDAYSFDPKDNGTGVYNDNWGVGIRLNLPIGPLRLDYGIPIKRDPRNNKGGRFQFGVGYTAEF